MHPNQTTLENFYTAFARLDANWTPFLRNKVKATAAANLQKFLASRST